MSTTFPIAKLNSSWLLSSLCENCDKICMYSAVRRNSQLNVQCWGLGEDTWYTYLFIPDSNLTALEGCSSCFCSGQRYGDDRSRGDHSGARRGRGGRYSDQRGPRSGHSATPYKREYPTGIDKLKKWLDEPADVIVMSLKDARSGFKELLKDDDIPQEKMMLFVKVLAKASSSECCRTNMFDVYSNVFAKPFIDTLLTFQLSLDEEVDEKVTDFLTDQIKLMNSFCKAMPNEAYDKLPKILQAVKLVLLQRAHNNCAAITIGEDYEKLQASFKARDPIEKGLSKLRLHNKLDFLDAVEPDEDYRTLTVEPSPDDLDIDQKPFIRRNIIDGKYRDVDTYLDVQFRLLREDFIRPLREGLNDFKNHTHGRNRNINVYRSVKMVSSEIRNDRLMHSVQIANSRKLRLENSKRLLHGNLLCISEDNFKSFSWATVAVKDDKNLQKGIVGIEMLFDKKMRHTSIYTLLESRTFFVSYKHVLTALQRLDANSLPLAEHIVHVQTHVTPPHYLVGDASYDLRVVLDPSYMKVNCSHAVGGIFQESDSKPPPEDRGINLKQVYITEPLAFWPSCNEFSLDQSQLEALHAALSQRLAVIQGPPGTGKTYLGKKITQILLHNSAACEGTPILIVCYTNHALDQFLEGMQSFTKNIVRIGSRSKSENMEQYQIKNMVFQLEKMRLMPHHIYNNQKELEFTARDLRRRFNTLHDRISKIQDELGIIGLETFIEQNIIPRDVAQKLNNRYLDWLLPSSQPKFNGGGANPSFGQLQWRDRTKEQVDIGNWEDIKEFRRQEEMDRLLEDDAYVPKANDDDFHLFAKELKSCEIAYQNLHRDFENQKMPQHQFNVHAAALSHQHDSMLQIIRSRDIDPVWADDVANNGPIDRLTYPEKCRLYATWTDQLKKAYMKEIISIEERFTTLSPKLSEVRDLKYLYVARQADIVGMTTTGAATYQSMLLDLKPRIGEYPGFIAIESNMYHLINMKVILKVTFHEAQL